MPSSGSLKMHDTSPEAQDELLKRYRALSPERRLRMASSMFDAGRALVAASIPASVKGMERELELFRRFYAQDYTAREIEAICGKIRESRTKRKEVTLKDTTPP